MEVTGIVLSMCWSPDGDCYNLVLVTENPKKERSFRILYVEEFKAPILQVETDNKTIRLFTWFTSVTEKDKSFICFYSTLTKELKTFSPIDPNLVEKVQRITRANCFAPKMESLVYLEQFEPSWIIAAFAENIAVVFKAESHQRFLMSRAVQLNTGSFQSTLSPGMKCYSLGMKGILFLEFKSTLQVLQVTSHSEMNDISVISIGTFSDCLGSILIRCPFPPGQGLFNVSPPTILIFEKHKKLRALNLDIDKSREMLLMHPKIEPELDFFLRFNDASEEEKNEGSSSSKKTVVKEPSFPERNALNSSFSQGGTAFSVFEGKTTISQNNQGEERKIESYFDTKKQQTFFQGAPVLSQNIQSNSIKEDSVQSGARIGQSNLFRLQQPANTNIIQPRGGVPGQIIPGNGMMGVSVPLIHSANSSQQIAQNQPRSFFSQAQGIQHINPIIQTSQFAIQTNPTNLPGFGVGNVSSVPFFNGGTSVPNSQDKTQNFQSQVPLNRGVPDQRNISFGINHSTHPLNPNNPQFYSGIPNVSMVKYPGSSGVSNEQKEKLAALRKNAFAVVFNFESFLEQKKGSFIEIRAALEPVVQILKETRREADQIAQETKEQWAFKRKDISKRVSLEESHLSRQKAALETKRLRSQTKKRLSPFGVVFNKTKTNEFLLNLKELLAMNTFQSFQRFFVIENSLQAVIRSLRSTKGERDDVREIEEDFKEIRSMKLNKNDQLDSLCFQEHRDQPFRNQNQKLKVGAPFSVTGFSKFKNEIKPSGRYISDIEVVGHFGLEASKENSKGAEGKREESTGLKLMIKPEEELPHSDFIVQSSKNDGDISGTLERQMEAFIEQKEESIESLERTIVTLKTKARAKARFSAFSSVLFGTDKVYVESHPIAKKYARNLVELHEPKLVSEQEIKKTMMSFSAINLDFLQTHQLI